MTTSAAAATKPREPVQLRQLTSLRFFAALAVVFSHLAFLRNIENPLRPIAETVFYEGYAGVSFFFVLSGFILSYTYQDHLVQKSISTRTYLLLRLSRVFPIHLITALPFAAYFLYRSNPDILQISVANLLLLQSWIPKASYYFSLNAVSWSLSVELFFYSSFILLARCSTRSLQLMASVWLLLIGAAAAALIHQEGGDWAKPSGELKWGHWFFYINPVVRLLDFIVGMLIYRLAFLRSRARNHSLNEVMSILLLILGMYAFSAYGFPEILRAQLLYLPLMAFVVYAFSSGGGVVSRLLKSKTTVLLGEASFSLYMIHPPLIAAAYFIYQKTGEPIPVVVLAIVLTLLCVATSVVTYKLVEKPIHNYLKRRIRASK